jgi:hypothetical protein
VVVVVVVVMMMTKMFQWCWKKSLRKQFAAYLNLRFPRFSCRGFQFDEGTLENVSLSCRSFKGIISVRQCAAKGSELLLLREAGSLRCIELPDQLHLIGAGSSSF